jgi:alkylation response protein AidB-like acyl-CoA dehydrogenase
VTTPATTASESVESFRQRARTWIQANLQPLDPNDAFGAFRTHRTEEEELALVAHERDIQRMLFDAGFAGICFPTEYGGQNLTHDHQRAFNEEIAGFEYPSRFQAPTFAPCAGVLLEFGTEEQKQQHIPAMLKGEEIWMQLLSEPSGGSDVAAAITTAERDGDDWILNGSKVWTTGAWWSDWGLVLARTNWDVPKHRGLTVFMMPLHQEGVAVHRIEMLNGSKEFCQEYMDDVRIPDSDRVGEIDGGWTVGTRWMYHERVLLSSPLVTMPIGSTHGGAGAGAMVHAAEALGKTEDPAAHELIGEARMLELVKFSLQRRVADSMMTGKLSDQGAAVARLFTGWVGARIYTLNFDLGGGIGAAWSEDDDNAISVIGEDFLMRQSACIGGGTLEMARNVVSERVLGMPREPMHDKNLAFRDVPRGPTGR